MFDGKAFGLEIVEAVKQHIDRSVSPLVGRMDALERRFSELPVPRDGKDAEPDAVAAIVAERMLPELKELRTAVEALPPAPELPDIAGMIDAAVKTIPAPAELPDIPALISEAVAALPPAQDGKDADPALVASLVTETTERILAGWQRPEDGKSVTVEELRPLVEESVSAIPAPKDGINLAGGMIDRDGNLVLTLSNGTTAPLGKVVGTDGTDVDMAAIERSIAEKVDAIPKPKDADPAMIARMIDEAVAKHAPGPPEFAPDEVAQDVSLALKTMAGFVSKVVPEKQERPANNGQPTINITLPRAGAEKVQVTEHSADGRIKAYVKTPIEEA